MALTGQSRSFQQSRQCTKLKTIDNATEFGFFSHFNSSMFFSLITQPPLAMHCSGILARSFSGQGSQLTSPPSQVGIYEQATGE